MADHGKKPYVVDIEELTTENTLFRDTIWTGEHIQMTVMSIPPGGDIGLEVHEDTDQFIRIEAGEGKCEMGETKDNLDFVRDVEDDDVILVPAGMWHNVTNTGDEPLQVYSIYSPPEHPHGTIHATKAEADADEHDH